MERKTKKQERSFDRFFDIWQFFPPRHCFKIEVQPISSPDPQGPSVASPNPKVDKLEADDEEKMVLPTPGHIDPEKQRFPYCIVWTPIPFLTWVKN